MGTGVQGRATRQWLEMTVLAGKGFPGMTSSRINGSEINGPETPEPKTTDSEVGEKPRGEKPEMKKGCNASL